MPTPRWIVGLTFAAAGCSGDVTGPTDTLRFRVDLPSPAEIIPGEPLPVRVEVQNFSPFAVVFRGCAPALAVVRDESTDLPTSSRCTDGRFEIPPGGALVDTAVWSGQALERDESYGPGAFPPARTDLPSGTYQIHPVLLHAAEVVARGEPREVVIRPWARVRLVNTAGENAPVDLVVGGQVVARGVPPGAVSGLVVAPAGTQVLEARRSDEAAPIATSTVELVDGLPRLFAIRRGVGAAELWDIPDGEPTIAPYETHLRVVHLAESAAAVELRIFAPGSAAPHLLAPFAYGGISPYLSGTTDGWRLVVTTGTADTLLATAPMPLPGGTSYTAVLVDSPTNRIWATLVEGFRLP